MTKKISFGFFPLSEGFKRKKMQKNTVERERERGREGEKERGREREKWRQRNGDK